MDLDLGMLSNATDSPIIDLYTRTMSTALSVVDLDHCTWWLHITEWLSPALPVLRWLVDISQTRMHVSYNLLTLFAVAVAIFVVVHLLTKKPVQVDSATQSEDTRTETTELLHELSAGVRRLEERIASVERIRHTSCNGGTGDHGCTGFKRFALEVCKLQARLSRLEHEWEKKKHEASQVISSSSNCVGQEKEKLSFAHLEESAIKLPKNSTPLNLRRESAHEIPVRDLHNTRLPMTSTPLRSESEQDVTLRRELKNLKLTLSAEPLPNKTVVRDVTLKELQELRNNLEASKLQHQNMLKEFKIIMLDVGRERSLTFEAIRDAVCQLKKMPDGVKTLRLAIELLETIQYHISFGQHARLRRVKSFLSQYDNPQLKFSTTI